MAADVFAGGMYLKNEYSYRVENTQIQANLVHESHKIRWSDGWDLTLTKKRPFDDGADIDDVLDGGVDFRSDYRYLTVEAGIETGPWISAGLTLHAADSLFFAGSRIARGNLNFGTILWKSNQGNENIPDISAPWESDILQKGFSLGSQFGRQEISVDVNHTQSTPHNRDQEYYIRDSIDIWKVDARYRNGNAEFGYTFTNADATLYGIRHQDDSRKRFLYAPLESRFHFVEYVQHDILGSLTASGLNAAGRQGAGGVNAASRQGAGVLDLRIFAGHGELNLSNDGERFHETLAPNRALRSSLIQVLSFSFLQQNYRIDADLDASAETIGFAYRKPIAFGSAQSSAKGAAQGSANSAANNVAGRFVQSSAGGVVLAPNISANIYYAEGSADINQVSETTKFIGVSARTKKYAWNVNSFGALLGLGMNFYVGPVELNIAAHQILPITFEVERNCSARHSSYEGCGDSDSGSNSSSSGLGDPSLRDNLGNGLLATATLNVRW